MNLLFAPGLCERPDLLVQRTIKKIAIQLFKHNRRGEPEPDESNGKEEADANDKDVDVDDEAKIFFRRYALAKFLFILSNTAIKLLVYIEQKEVELKRLKEREKDGKGHKANQSQVKAAGDKA